MTQKLNKFFHRKHHLGHLVLENVVVGSFMGALVGLILKGYLKYLANLEMDWVIFLLIGLMIGLFSGFARQSHRAYSVWEEADRHPPGE